MPKQLYKLKNGDIVLQEEDGRLRPPTEKELANTIPHGMMGTAPIGERLKMTNFMQPESAKMLLRSRGNYVASFGPGFNFAYQKARQDETGKWLPHEPEAWIIVDPPGFDNTKEFFLDMLDATADVAVGFATGLGATAGSAVAPGVGTAAGAAAAGAGAEALRQGIGAALGAENNFDPLQIGVAAAGGAATPVVSKLGGLVLRGVRRGAVGAGGVAAELAGRLGGVPSQRALSAGDALMMKANMLAKNQDMKTALDVITLMKKKFSWVKTQGFGEVLQAKKLILAGANKTIDARRPLNFLKAIRDTRSLFLAEETAARNAENTLGRIYQLIGDHDPRRLPVAIGQEIKEQLQDILDAKGYYDAIKLKVPKGLREYFKGVGAVQKSFRRRIENQFGGRTGELAGLNEITAEKSAGREWFEGMIGRAEKDGAFQTKRTAENFLLNTFGRGRSADLRDIRKIDKLWNLGFEDLIAEAYVGDVLGTGTPSILPVAFTAGSGQFRGPSLIQAAAPASLGFLFGGPTGLALGAAAASPRGLVAGAQAIAGLGRVGAPSRAVTATLNALERQIQLLSAESIAALPPAQQAAAMASRTAAITAFQTTMKRYLPQDRPVLRQDAKRRELLEGR